MYLRKSREQIESELCFDVYEQPVFHMGKETNFKLIVRADNHNPISCMTKQYKLVPNRLILEAVENAIAGQNYALTDARSFSDARMKLEITMNREITVNGKASYPRVIVRNSYDGTSAVSFSAAIMILVCSNGLMAFRNFTQRTYLHYEKNDIISDIGKSIESSIALIENKASDMFLPLTRTMAPEQNVSVIRDLFPGKLHDSFTENFLAHNNRTYWDLLDTSTYLISNVMNRDNEYTHKLEESITDRVFNLYNKGVKQEAVNATV